MFDIGGWEFLVIIVVAIVVIGPKDLPATIRTVAGWIRRARELARDFQSGLDDLAREAELDDLKKDLHSGLGIDEVTEAGNSIRRDIEQSVDPDREIAEAFEDDPLAADALALEEDEPPRKVPPQPTGIAAVESETLPHAGELPPDDAPVAADEEPAGRTRKA